MEVVENEKKRWEFNGEKKMGKGELDESVHQM
jgi:hypothetical protein